MFMSLKSKGPLSEAVWRDQTLVQMPQSNIIHFQIWSVNWKLFSTMQSYQIGWETFILKFRKRHPGNCFNGWRVIRPRSFHFGCFQISKIQKVKNILMSTIQAVIVNQSHYQLLCIREMPFSPLLFSYFYFSALYTIRSSCWWTI